MNDTEVPIDSGTGEVRARILHETAALIRAHGTDAATTRAVAMAASVQAPTIYRLFGDKDALLDAVAEHELALYVAGKKHRKPEPDPVEALRKGWDRHVAFGLANPGLFWIMSRNAHSSAAMAGRNALAARVHDIAVAGRLQGSEARVAALVHASCVGTIITLLADNGNAHATLSADARESVLAAVTTSSVRTTAGGVKGAATTLRARLADGGGVLTPGERGLLDELLQRLSDED